MPDSIHRERLEQIALDDVDFRDALIGVYLDDTREQLAALDRAVGESDEESLLRIAHRLKGSSANLGAVPLAQLCAEAERRFQSADAMDDLTRLLEAIADEFRRVEHALGAIVEERSR